MTGKAAQNRWPRVKINLNETTVDDFAIVESKKVEYEITVDIVQEYCTINVIYYNKTDQDTVVDHAGQILENQNITVDSVCVNGVDLVKTKLIYQDIGAYHMDISSSKKQYFIDNGINIEPSQSLSMSENGTWAIKLGVPVLSFLSQKQQRLELAEKQNHQPILEEIHQKILDIRNFQATQKIIT